MSWYRSIVAINGIPNDAGPDDALRQTWTVNFQASIQREAGVNVLKELASPIVDAGVAVLGTDFFLATSVKLPAGDGPYLQLLSTISILGRRSHGTGSDISTYDDFRFMLVARGTDGQAAYTMALDARDELDNTFNTELVAA